MKLFTLRFSLRFLNGPFKILVMNFFKVVIVLYFLSFGHTAAATGERLIERIRLNDIRGPLVKSITSGSKLALESCQTEFRWEKWNCPLSSFARRPRESVTKEIAFITAVQSAGVTYDVSKACSSGLIPSCGCRKDFKYTLGEAKASSGDESPTTSEVQLRENWHWNGCIDDISMGMAVSQRFFDSLESYSADVLTRVKKHNGVIGAHTVKHSAQIVCHCHGILGSCTMKTCWRKLVPFQDISKKLKVHYQKAQRVQENRAIPRESFDVSVHKLIFLDDSPNYCIPNANTGWRGTGGRICSQYSRYKASIGNKSSPAAPIDKSEKRSCRELCRSCGHQVRRRPVNVTWSCNCTFQWRFNVKCETCQKTIMQAYCDERPVKLY